MHLKSTTSTADLLRYNAERTRITETMTLKAMYNFLVVI